MSKKLLKYFFISFILITACAPKPGLELPPSLYSGEELSLAEIVSRVSGETEVIKVIADIKINKNNKPFDSISASVLIKRPGHVHMRIYKLGMLAKDFVIKDDELYVLSGKSSSDLKRLGTEFYNSVFWWDNIKDGIMQRNTASYIIKKGNNEIYLDRATLLPLKQKITTFNNSIEILYNEPQQSEDGYWYPSVLEINLDNFTFNIKLKKLMRNPILGRADFSVF